MDSSRSHDPRLHAAGRQSSTYPYENGQQPPKRTSPSIQPQGPGGTYPYDPQIRQQPPVQPPQQQQPPQQPRTERPAAKRNPAGRRALGVVAFFVLSALSLPLHIGAIFFIYIEFESPGDLGMAVLLVGGAFAVSFAALFVTGLVTQKIGGFPGMWRARITFAALSGIIALAVAYVAALYLF